MCNIVRFKVSMKSHCCQKKSAAQSSKYHPKNHENSIDCGSSDKLGNVKSFNWKIANQYKFLSKSLSICES